jgi:aldehyde dehydrogenase (NAD+)
MSPIATQAHELLARMGVAKSLYTEGTLTARSPVDGAVTGRVVEGSAADMQAAIGQAHAAFLAWRVVPAPKRGELVRRFGEVLRAHKADLAALVTLEAGKISSEGAGEVQEMIDICDFAVGLSRQLHGLTIASERPGHRMMEQWHPLGVVGIIRPSTSRSRCGPGTARWRFVCGDACVWKPSEKTPLTALATQALFEKAAAYRADGHSAPEGLSQLVNGGAATGEALVSDPRVAAASAPPAPPAWAGWSVPRSPRASAGFSAGAGRQQRAHRGADKADLDLAVRAIAFGAWGTAGQRCTTTRRVIAHRSVHDTLVARLDKRARAAHDRQPARRGHGWSVRWSTSRPSTPCRPH